MRALLEEVFYVPERGWSAQMLGYHEGVGPYFSLPEALRRVEEIIGAAVWKPRRIVQRATGEGARDAEPQTAQAVSRRKQDATDAPPVAVARDPHRLTFAAFSEANRQRCEDPQGFNHALSSWSTSDWFVAIVGELGEAANIVKKLNRVRDGVRGNKESEAALRAKLRGELADAFIYLDLIFQACGFDTGDAIIDTFDAKSAEIGYLARLRGEAAVQQWRQRAAMLYADARHEEAAFLETRADELAALCPAPEGA